MATNNSVNNTLGTFIVDSSNRATNANQPAFYVYKTGVQTGVTGEGTAVTVTFDTIVRNQGSNFASNTFTAPVTGLYFFAASIAYGAISASNTSANSYIHITTSGSSRDFSTIFNAAAERDSNNNKSDNIAGLLYLNANDTVVVQGQAWNNGSKNVNLGTSDGRNTFFSGFLIC